MAFASPQQAMAFYGEVINLHEFDRLLPVLSNDVTFWFSSGSFRGIHESRRAFESTWRRIAEEYYWLEDLHWLSMGDTSAACTYTFHWRGLLEGIASTGSGRGTTVLRYDHGWRIVHEHLSAEPAE